MRNLLSKLKSQRGATGTDILVSASIIVISIGIVSVMYVNTSLQSRNITRTAGANRIATNLIENIDAMSYDDFLTTYGASNTSVTKTGSSTMKYFNTKIPQGYTAVIKAVPVYGSHTANTEKFDLVRQVEITVSYNVGKATEKVEFSTVKKRELLKECNEPATADLRPSLKNGMNYYPVKYLPSAKAYVKTTENDSEWYNYATKNWATVIVSKKSESDLFDVNGKFIGTINVDTANSAYTQKFVWVPKFFTSSTSNQTFKSFAFSNTTDKKIVNATLPSVANTSASNFNYYKASALASGEYNNTSWGTATGIWSAVKADNTFASTFATGLNTSTYGPCNIY